MKYKKDDEDDDIIGVDVDGVDGDDSDEDEVDVLLERDEGLEMGLVGEEEFDDEDGNESEGEFDYDKLEYMEEDVELDGEDFDILLKEKKKKGSKVEVVNSDFD